MSNITDVTRINSNPISAFGGINFVFDYLNKLKIDKLCQEQLPCIAAQSKYSRKDIFYSLNSNFLCGGDSVEDLQTHLKSHFINNLPAAGRFNIQHSTFNIQNSLDCTTKKRQLPKNNFQIPPQYPIFTNIKLFIKTKKKSTQTTTVKALRINLFYA